MRKGKTYMFSKANLNYKPTKSKKNAKGSVRFTKNKTIITKYKK